MTIFLALLIPLLAVPLFTFLVSLALGCYQDNSFTVDGRQLYAVGSDVYRFGLRFPSMNTIPGIITSFICFTFGIWLMLFSHVADAAASPRVRFFVAASGYLLLFAAGATAFVMLFPMN